MIRAAGFPGEQSTGPFLGIHGHNRIFRLTDSLLTVSFALEHRRIWLITTVAASSVLYAFRAGFIFPIPNSAEAP